LITGGILFFGGTMTALNTLIAGGEENKKTLYLVGGVQAGTGLILTFSSRPGKYAFKHTVDPWGFK
jgi:hypothetical protein